MVHCRGENPIVFISCPKRHKTKTGVSEQDRWGNKVVHPYLLVSFKAQLGEPFLGSLVFYFSFFQLFAFFLLFFFFFFFLFFAGKPALKPPKPALKQPNRPLKKKKKSKNENPALKGPNRHLTEALGELCLK